MEMKDNGRFSTARRVGYRRWMKYFPITTIDNVVELFKDEICGRTGPDLAFASILIGAVEAKLTIGTSDVKFPDISFADVEVLYSQFSSILRESVLTTEVASCRRGSVTVSNRQIVQKVSDVVWSCLNTSYHKDRPHIQSLFSLLTEKKLDCFGVALCVVAACQHLGLDDVQLAMSEDHVWIVFGENLSESAEVTWHGKAFEDKRGKSVIGSQMKKNWLYLNGHSVICSRHMELASIVSSINPLMSNTGADNITLISLQQRLWWILYDAGHLSKYPIALSCLGEMEELKPTSGRPMPLTLYRQAVTAAQTFYANMHIYPYTYLGAYFYRRRRFRDALSAWADAADIIRNYNHSRDDDEVYKVFMEIANEIIPQILRMDVEGCRVLTSNAEVYGTLLRFYDGLCCWEEDSQTPVLHITWATHMLSSISKFDSEARIAVCLVDVDNKLTKNGTEVSDGDIESTCAAQRHETPPVSPPVVSEQKDEPYQSNPVQSLPVTKNIDDQVPDKVLETASNEEAKMNVVVDQLTTQSDDENDRNSELEALAHACGESLLNPDFLLGSGEPFVHQSDHQLLSVATNTQMDLNVFATLGHGHGDHDDVPETGTLSKPDLHKRHHQQLLKNASLRLLQPRVALYSAKMKAVKQLLTAAKLNANAVKLQLTAQTHVGLKQVQSQSSSSSSSLRSTGQRRAPKRHICD